MNLKSLLGLVSLFSSSSQGTTSFARQPTPASVILITRGLMRCLGFDDDQDGYGPEKDCLDGELLWT